MKHQSRSDLRSNNGFTMSELLASIAIVGILSTIAIPNYTNQLERAKQRQAAAIIEQMMTRLVASKEEMGTNPITWIELSNESAIITTTGIIKDTDGELTNKINLAEINYTIQRTDNTDPSNYYELTATNKANPNRNVMGCINLDNGASTVKLGIEDRADNKPVVSTDLLCN